MIQLINEGRRPTLDRDYQHNLHANKATVDTYRELVERTKGEVCQSDLHESLLAILREDPDLQRRSLDGARRIANDNKKYPKDLPAIDASAPDLTAEASFINVDGSMKEAFPEPPPTKGKPMAARKLKLPEPKGKDLWTPLAPALKVRVSEQNFETWLSSVRFLASNETTLALLVPNTFFQEYLGEHYTEVIQEEMLRKYGSHYEIEFTVMSQEVETVTPEEIPAPKVPALLQLIIDRGVKNLDDLEALEDEVLPDLYRRRMDEAKRRSDGCVARYAAEISILEAQRKREEAHRIEFRKKRREKLSGLKTVGPLRQPGNPQHQKQYSKSSHWDTDGGVNRKDLS